MSDTLQVPRVSHATSAGIAADIAFVQSEANVDRREIGDGTALAIAAGWQAPGGHGRTFAALIGHFAVDVTDLTDAIAYEYPHADADAKRELDCLATWALNHPSRTYPLPRNV